MQVFLPKNAQFFQHSQHKNYSEEYKLRNINALHWLYTRMSADAVKAEGVERNAVCIQMTLSW